MHTILGYLEALDKNGNVIAIPGLVGDPNAFGEIEILLDGSPRMLSDFNRFHDTHRALRFLMLGQDVEIRERTRLLTTTVNAAALKAPKKK